MKTSMCCGTLGLSIWLACALPVVAQDSPLGLFGGDVDVLMRLKEPDRAIEGIVALVDAIQPGAGEIITLQAEEHLGQLISNPTLTGVDQTRDWYAGVYADGGGAPTVVFAIPAISAEDLQGALGKNMASRIVGDWVLYTEEEELPEVGDQTAVDTISEAAWDEVKQGTLGIYVNVAHLTNVYSEQIEIGQEQVLEQLNNLRFAMPQQEGIDLGAIIEIYGTIAENIFQGLSDAKSFTMSVSADERGIAIDEFVEFTDGTSTADFLSQQPTSDMAVMRSLPEGAVAYYGVSGFMKELTRWGLDVSVRMMGSDETQQKMAELQETIEDVKYGPMVAAVQLGQADTGMFNVAAIFEATPIDKIKVFVRESSQLAGTMEVEDFKQTTELQADAETIGDQPVDILTMKQEFLEDSEANRIQQQMQQLMFGPDGMVSRTAYLEDRYVTTMGGGKEAMESLLNRLSAEPTGELPAYDPPLHEQTNLIAHIDLPTMGIRLVQTAAESGTIPLMIDQNMIDSLNLSPTYLGFAIGVEGNALHCQTRIPMDQIRGFAKIGVLFAALQGQRL